MATKAVGKLWVGLDLKTNGFEAGLKKSEALTKKSAVKMKSTFKSVFSGVVLGNLVTAGITKALATVKQAITKIFAQFEGLDAIAKMARQLDISSVALIAWKRAAEFAGTGGDTLVKGLEKLSINLGMAADKGGPAADALKQMGLDARILAAGPLDVAFSDIADAIDKEDNAIQRAFLTAQLFGKAGPKIALMMEGGAKSLQEAIKSAKEDGIAFNEAELARIESANDAILRMKESFDAIFKGVAVVIAPSIERAADALQKAFATAANDSDGIANAFDGVVIALTLIVGTFQTLAGALLTVGATIAATIGGLVVIVDDMLSAIPGSEGFLSETSKIEIAAAASKSLDDAVGMVTSGAEKIGDVFSGKLQADLIGQRNEVAAQADKDKLAKEQEAAIAPIVTPAKALLAGSQEAQAAINAFRVSGEGNQDVQDEILAEQKHAAAVAEKQAQEMVDGFTESVELAKKLLGVAKKQIKPLVATIGV